MRRRFVSIIACFALSLLSGIFIWSSLRASKPPFLTISAPAYETLLLAAQRVASRDPAPDINSLHVYVRTNTPALQTVREALRQRFEAPKEAYGTAAEMGVVLNQVGTFKSLANILKNEGELHERESRFAEAAQSYADIIQLGTKVEAGTVIFAMVGISFERIGIEALQQLEPDLQGSVRKEIASKLRAINSQRVTFESIEDRERYIRRRHSPTPLHYLFFSHQLRSVRANTQNKYEISAQAVDAMANKLEIEQKEISGN